MTESESNTTTTRAGLAPLAPGRRLVAVGTAFALLYLAGPGILSAEGSAVLAVLALALWGRTVSRPGRKAWAVEFLCAAVAWAGIVSWAAYVWPGLLLWLGPGMAVYMTAQSVLLRRLVPRLPLALALPTVWILSEGVRATLMLPFGFEWMRLGTHLHAVEWLSGSARVWSIGGLSWVLAALAGWLGDLAARGLDGRRMTALGHACGLGPTALAALLTVLIPAPETRPGPDILMVQPSWTQERKRQQEAPYDLFVDVRELTAEGLAAGRAQGLGAPDLVAWGESMLPTLVVEPGLPEAVAAGLEQASWIFGGDLTEDLLRRIDQQQRSWVDQGLFGQGESEPPLFPAGTSFITGAERLVAREGKLRRQGAVALWDGPGAPGQISSKLHLVPGAETMLGLERIPVVRDTIFELAGYIPDLLPPTDEPRALTLETPTGSYRFGVSVCFDNAFDDVFTRPFAEGDVDFHLVLTNEAWFKQNQEADQMIAFSRLEALSTGRAICRAANSGISCVLGPDGRMREHLQVEGRDREVRGTLRARLPVPVDPAHRTPFVALERYWVALWLLLPLTLLAAFGRRERYPGGSPGKTPGPRS